MPYPLKHTHTNRFPKVSIDHIHLTVKLCETISDISRFLQDPSGTSTKCLTGFPADAEGTGDGAALL